MGEGVVCREEGDANSLYLQYGSKYTYFRVIILFVEKRQRCRINIKLKNKLKWE